MKQNYLNLTLFCVISLIGNTNAQTYIVDSSGNGNCNRPGNLDHEFICVSAGSPLTSIGSFTDTNPSGTELTSMSMIIYDACNGEFEVFINGVSVGTDTTTNTGCSCESIASNSNITRSINITVTPQIAAAYTTGGSNTISITTNNTQCFYGAEVTVSTNTLNVKDNKADGISIYPNPVQKELMVSGLKKIEAYRIYSILGIIVKQGNVSRKNPINVSDLYSGSYYLTFENGNTISFIKQ